MRLIIYICLLGLFGAQVRPATGEPPPTLQETSITASPGQHLTHRFKLTNGTPDSIIELANLPGDWSFIRNGQSMSGQVPTEQGLYEVDVTTANECGSARTTFPMLIRTPFVHQEGVMFSDTDGKVIRFNEKFIAQLSQKLMMSSDGISWTEITPGYKVRIYDLYVTGEHLVAVTNAGIGLSKNGSDWETIAFSEDAVLRRFSTDGVSVHLVGGRNQFFVSEDLRNWTAVPLEPGTDIYYIEFGNHTFVAVTSNHQLIVSHDGRSWETVGAAMGIVDGLTYGSEGFLVLNRDKAVYRSSDGLEWTKVAQLHEAVCGNLVFENGNYFAFEPMRLWKSLDGRAWTRKALVDRPCNPSISYGSGVYVIADRYTLRTINENWFPTVVVPEERVLAREGETTEILLTTIDEPGEFHATGLPDGLTLDSTTGVIAGKPLESGLFNVYAAASNSSGYSGLEQFELRVYPKTGSPPVFGAPANIPIVANFTEEFWFRVSNLDETSHYTATDLPPGVYLDVSGVSPGIFRGAPTPGIHHFEVSVNNAHGKTSTTGTIWAPRNLWRRGAPPFVERSVALFGTSNGFWAFEMGITYSSADGLSWTTIESNLPSKPVEVTQAFGRTFFAVMTNGEVFSSTDGSDWQSRFQPEGGPQLWNTVFAVGDDRIIFANGDFTYASTDGMNWIQSESLSISTQIGTLGYGNGLFLATAGGSVFRSIDGINWEQVSEEPFSSFDFDFAYGNGKYLFASQRGVISSDDGINWEWNNSDNRESLTPIIFGNGQFIAGRGPNLLTSPDGVNWHKFFITDDDFPQSNLSLVYGSGRFLALADSVSFTTFGSHSGRFLGSGQDSGVFHINGKRAFGAFFTENENLDSFVFLESSDLVTFTEFAPIVLQDLNNRILSWRFVGKWISKQQEATKTFYQIKYREPTQ